MKHEPGQYGCTPETDAASLITYGFAKRFLKDCRLGNYTDEIYQDMQCRLLIAKREGKPISPQYAFGILHNLAMDKLKNLGKQRASEKTLADLAKSDSREQLRASPEEIATRNELKREIDRIIKEELPPRQRVVVNLRFFSQQKLIFKRIGRIIGFSESTARVEYHKALRHIKARLNAEREEELRPLGEPDLQKMPRVETQLLERKAL